MCMLLWLFNPDNLESIMNTTDFTLNYEPL